MYERPVFHQPDFDELRFPLAEMIDLSDDLCILADRVIDWDRVDREYRRSFKSRKGRKACSSRLAFGLLFLKERYGFSNREVVNQLKQNPYFQYFCGYQYYSPANTVNHTELGHFFRRFGLSVTDRVSVWSFVNGENVPSGS